MCQSCNLKLLVLIIFILATVTPPSATAAPADDACLLLTQAQLAAAFGVSFAPGQHTTPTYLKTCTWIPSGGSTDTLKFVTLNLESASAYDGGKNMMQQMKPKGVIITPASGIGDDSYYISFGSNITNLMVKKGTVSFKLAIYGATPPEKAMAIEKTLALQFVSKL